MASATSDLPAEADTHCAYPRKDGQAELTRPKTVTHPGTNRAHRKVTTLIETNALPLSFTANEVIMKRVKRAHPLVSCNISTVCGKILE